MIKTFQSLDEAAHHLYLAGEPGPLLCRVDGSLWEAWSDGRARFVSDEPAA